MIALSNYITSAPVAPPVEKCYSLLKGEDLMQIHSNAINLVLGRDLRRNVLYASTMALELAASGKRVVYLNTYASENLLRFSFTEAANVKDGTDVMLEEIPTGEWNADTLGKMLETQQAEVVILNSFEFSALTRYHREAVARDLIRLQKQMSLTVIIFSHEIKRDIEARCMSRGAIGILASVSESVSKVGDEWRLLQMASSRATQASIGEYGTESRRVNEKQTLNKYFLPKKFGGTRPNPTVDIPNDRGFSYHYGDFWCNPFERGPYADYSGSGMSVLARTPLLQQYLLERPKQIFMMGNTPSEAELFAKQTVG